MKTIGGSVVEILYKERSFSVIGAAMEVHRLLGAGFLEAVYQKALAYELILRKIPFEEQVRLPVTYKDVLVGDYIADFVIDGSIILEIKAVPAIIDAHKAQAINYLAATGYELAILLNFGEPRLHQERLVRHKNYQKTETA